MSGAAGVVVWCTGAPSAGKSTLARAAVARLREHGRAAALLDGDELRAVLKPSPGYDPAGRDAFYATLAGLAALLSAQGLIVVVAATAHRRAYRDEARRLAPRFVEVFVDASEAERRRRDSKGLYQAETTGDVRGLPGADIAYEPPLAAEVRAEGGADTEALERLLELVGR